ncbi:MAG: hypothetical protein ACD_71C00105G0003 [uncultured bacterium (gcode 4)]|uniref:Uncharacterized protein n=1 Tax=uncultured bacterium (gcode 4) TaxID=1234023 RepID=K1ZJD9_9BACT|nr:MAG: hypothetical protein ACD_71C00105G0003 [uncultured bacterium (gcode 4)]
MVDAIRNRHRIAWFNKKFLFICVKKLNKWHTKSLHKTSHISIYWSESIYS